MMVFKDDPLFPFGTFGMVYFQGRAVKLQVSIDMFSVLKRMKRAF